MKPFGDLPVYNDPTASVSMTVDTKVLPLEGLGHIIFPGVFSCLTDLSKPSCDERRKQQFSGTIHSDLFIPDKVNIFSSNITKLDSWTFLFWDLFYLWC